MRAIAIFIAFTNTVISLWLVFAIYVWLFSCYAEPSGGGCGSCRTLPRKLLVQSQGLYIFFWSSIKSKLDLQHSIINRSSHWLLSEYSWERLVGRRTNAMLASIVIHALQMGIPGLDALGYSLRAPLPKLVLVFNFCPIDFLSVPVVTLDGCNYANSNKLNYVLLWWIDSWVLRWKVWRSTGIRGWRPITLTLSPALNRPLDLLL